MTLPEKWSEESEAQAAMIDAAIAAALEAFLTKMANERRAPLINALLAAIAWHVAKILASVEPGYSRQLRDSFESLVREKTRRARAAGVKPAQIIDLGSRKQ